MLHFKIVTPERVAFEGNVVQVSVPTTSGEITILPHHIALVSVIAPGEMKVRDEHGQELLFAVSGGCVEVQPNNEVAILSDSADRVEEIDVAKAEEAHARAVAEMEKLKNVADVDFTRLQAVIERETNRVRVGKKYRQLPPQQ